jgi:hypothetical protein
MRPTLLFCVLAAVAAPARAEPITMRALLGELIDLDHLSRLPAPAYTLRQASSYDRQSVAPDKPGWFANYDKGQYLRSELHGGRREQVMMDADGPGVVVRIWSANPEGVLRVYLDGAEQPALEAPMKALLSGEVAPFVRPLAHEVARGLNLYFPFPYQKHCRITTDKGADMYYQVDYRTYSNPAAVQTFTLAEAVRLGPEIDRVARALAPSAELPGIPRRFSLTDGKPIVLSGGPGVVRGLRLRVAPVDPILLRRTVLVMRFDREETVRAPLGDFFGSGPRLNPYLSLPLGQKEDGSFYSRWPMPYRRSVELEVHNLDGAPIKIEAELFSEGASFGEDRLVFHARWRAPEDLSTSAPRDWNLVALEGKGIYVGNMLNIDYFARSWWGEGDEKIYVDGETFPGIFGTGTEDYYGYAWCDPALFSHAYHNQTRVDARSHLGHSSVNRWHVLDPIPFGRSFRFDLEVIDWPHNTHVIFDSVVYWYSRPGGKDNIPTPKPEDYRIP